MVRKTDEQALEITMSVTPYTSQNSEPAVALRMSVADLTSRAKAGSQAMLTYLSSPEAEVRAEFRNLMSVVDDFGIGQLSIAAAAGLIAAERWLADEVEANLPEGEDFLFDDPRLFAALKSEIERLQVQLINAIEAGELLPSHVRRDLASGTLLPLRTFISSKRLHEWLESREFRFGQFFDSYKDREQQIRTALLHDLYNMRMVFVGADAGSVESRWTQFLINRSPILNSDKADIASRSHDQLVAMVELALSEVSRLQGELAQMSGAVVEAPLHAKSRRTLYRVIAALCQQAKIKPGDRSAAGDLQAITQRSGLSVDDDVLRDILKALPEVKEDR